MVGEVTASQKVPAPPRAVFTAWTTPRLLARWWWPHLPDTTYRIEARTGASFAIESLMAGIGVEGEYVVFDEPRALEMTWRWLNDGVSKVEETVSVDFRPSEGGTEVALVHELGPGAGDGANQLQGWRDVMARLPAACA